MIEFQSLRELIALTLGIPESDITPDTVQADIPKWDSVAQLNLMLSLEDTYRVEIQADDLSRLTSVPKIVSFLSAARGTG